MIEGEKLRNAEQLSYSTYRSPVTRAETHRALSAGTTQRCLAGPSAISRGGEALPATEFVFMGIDANMVFGVNLDQRENR
jgi:hypothetical protein